MEISAASPMTLYVVFAAKKANLMLDHVYYEEEDGSFLRLRNLRYFRAVVTCRSGE
jgi:hypothetical protein